MLYNKLSDFASDPQLFSTMCDRITTEVVSIAENGIYFTHFPSNIILIRCSRNLEIYCTHNDLELVARLCTFSFDIEDYIRKIAQNLSMIKEMSRIHYKYQNLGFDIDPDKLTRIKTETCKINYAEKGKYFYATEIDVFLILFFEFSLLKRLADERIIKALTFESKLSKFGIIIEDYITLDDYCIRKGSLDLHEISEILLNVCYAVKFLHQNEIFLYIEPKNIFICGKHEVKLGNFFNIMNFNKSIYFMSPEVLRAENCSHKSDIWSLGMVFYWILFKRRPYHNLKSKSALDFEQDPKKKPYISNKEEEKYQVLVSIIRES